MVSGGDLPSLCALPMVKNDMGNSTIIIENWINQYYFITYVSAVSILSAIPYVNNSLHLLNITSF